jgi:ribonuclease HI
MEEKMYIVYTDGGSRGNPGEAAIGVVICDAGGNALKSYGEKIGIATNNEAEYQAAISALKKTKQLLGAEGSKHALVEVRADSELMVKQMNGQYKVREDRLRLLFVEVWNAMQDFKRVTFKHIPREQNAHADKMLNDALDGNNQQAQTLF